MTHRIRGIGFVVLGLAGLAGALFDARLRLPGVGAAVIFLFLASTVFSRASRIAASLTPLVKKSVRVEIWGLPLPAPGEVMFEIDAVSAFGVGLLIHLRAIPGGPRSLLKVAQPGPAKLEEGRIEIGEAAYVSWAGTRLKRAVGNMAPAVVLLS